MKQKVSDYSNTYLSARLEENLALFGDIFRRDDILRIKRLRVGLKPGFDAALLYFDGMVSITSLNDSVVRPLVLAQGEIGRGESRADYLAKRVLYMGDTAETGNVEEILRAVLYGDTLLLIDGCDTAVTMNTKGWRTRGISEPEDERILQGPREGFDEAAMLNVAMIRRKLLTPDLCIESMRIGRRTDTLVFMCYLGSLTDDKTAAELRRRLKTIDIDGILDTNYINEQIRDFGGSLFKTTGTTERPDVVAARLLEGRIALVVDGTPVVLTLPYLFSENFQSDEDYYINYRVASVGRVLRMLCFFLSVSVPGIYVAMTAFHEQLLPTAFALSIAEARGGVPFSTVAECIVLILIFEILKETGLRMPQSVGHALSIVGGLVVGQAAVEAKIVSAPMLIAVALSGIAGLMIPRLKAAVFYLRIGFVLLSALLGLYGYLAGVSLMLIRILSLSSFGVDYTVSLDTPTVQSMKDTVWRAPWRMMINRPEIQNKNKIRKRDARR